VTDGRRQRAAVLAELTSTQRWLREVWTAAVRRAGDLGRLRSECTSSRVRGALQATAGDVLVVAEQAEAALANLGDVSTLIAAERDEDGSPRG
jgi:hypothetical protein